jgi:hypothetical protein
MTGTKQKRQKQQSLTPAVEIDQQEQREECCMYIGVDEVIQACELERKSLSHCYRINCNHTNHLVDCSNQHHPRKDGSVSLILTGGQGAVQLLSRTYR